MTLSELWHHPGTKRGIAILTALFVVGWPVFTLLCAAVGD